MDMHTYALIRHVYMHNHILDSIKHPNHCNAYVYVSNSVWQDGNVCAKLLVNAGTRLSSDQPMQPPLTTRVIVHALMHVVMH